MRGRHQASDGDRQGPTRKKGNKVSETDRAFVRPATAFVMDNRNGFSCSYTDCWLSLSSEAGRRQAGNNSRRNLSVLLFL